MKIYPGNHAIATDFKQATQSTVQLGYFKDTARDVDLRVELNSDVVKNIQRNGEAVYPFQKFDSNKVTLFSSRGSTAEKIDGADLLKLERSGYYYEPKNTVEFTPPDFSYSVLIKKNDSYTSNVQYDVSLRCFNDTYNVYASDFISILGSAAVDRPSNITFNKNAAIYYSLVTNDDLIDNERIDFLVMDYDTYLESKEEIDGRFLDRHTNLWLVDSSFNGSLKHIYTDSIVVSEEDTLLELETSWSTRNYIANSNDLRVWYNDKELVRGVDFYEAYYNDSGTLCMATDKEEEFTANTIILAVNKFMKTGDVISYYIKSQDNVIYTITNPIINKNKTIYYPYENDDEVDKVAFDGKLLQSEIEENITDETYDIENLFVEEAMPIALVHKPDAGYIILSNESIIRNSQDCKELIYNILMHVYLNSYFETKKRTTWICDYAVESFIKYGNRLNERHCRINLTKLLSEDGYNLGIAYDELFETITSDNVVNDTSAYSKELRFRTKINMCPVRSTKEKSIYTVNGTIMNYDADSSVIYLLEDVPEIRNISETDRYGISINPYRSSLNNISVLHTTNLFSDAMSEPFLLNTYYIVYYDVIEKRILAVKKDNFDSEEKIPLANIILDSDTSIEIGDIRQLGGGEISSSNYEMIDSGNIYGRPIRIGSTFIIKLPERFKEYRTILEKELNKHIASGDYPILVFTNE